MIRKSQEEFLAGKTRPIKEFFAERATPPRKARPPSIRLMTPSFAVHPSSHYERLSTKLNKTRCQATGRSAAAILSTHPYNRSLSHHIRKLEGIPAGEGRYRLSLGRWRFRYDIAGRVALMTYCGLRREDTY